ncbi:serine hydrolase domain-containing protein [Elioraea tepidiphila]|uniref:serine hydrolase domain-containing protein n=1 Tax=Elioraea tepidiphila TaxID=457934 RepID=UPI002FDA6DD1
MADARPLGEGDRIGAEPGGKPCPSLPRGKDREGVPRRALAAGVAALAVAPRTAAGTDFARIDAALDEAVAAGTVPGLVALVARGETVHVHAAGVRSLETGAPMRRDTIFAVASIAKPLTAAAALLLVEDGVLGLDEPVDRFLPELANRRVIRSLEAPLDDTVPATRPLTLRDLLTMRMGLGAVFADPATSPLLRRMAELGVAPGPRLFQDGPDAFLRRLGSLPLVHQPGERWLYHTGLDVAGVLVARAAGMSLGAFQRERLFEPLGMADTGFFAPTGKAGRLATVYWRDRESGRLAVWNPASGAGFAAPPAFEAGGGGHVSTVDDMLAFGRMLLDRGTYRGRRILSEASVAAMLTDAITPAQKAASPFFPGFWDSHGWGLGIGLVTAPDAISPTPGRFGWWGGFGTTFWCDPATDTVALLFTQRMMGGPDDAALGNDFLRLAFAA